MCVPSHFLFYLFSVSLYYKLFIRVDPPLFPFCCICSANTLVSLLRHTLSLSHSSNPGAGIGDCMLIHCACACVIAAKWQQLFPTLSLFFRPFSRVRIFVFFPSSSISAELSLLLICNFFVAFFFLFTKLNCKGEEVKRCIEQSASRRDALDLLLSKMHFSSLSSSSSSLAHHSALSGFEFK